MAGKASGDNQTNLFDLIEEIAKSSESPSKSKASPKKKSVKTSKYNSDTLFSKNNKGDLFAAKAPEKTKPLSEKKSPPPPHTEEAPVQKSNSPEILSVSDLNKRIKKKLSENFSKIIVQGELADFKGIHRSGHLYCSLKDDTGQIRLVMWKGSLSKLPFKLEGGLEVIVRAKVDFYGANGSLQIVAESMEPVGIGALQLKFEQLKKKLREEGLFEESRKKIIEANNFQIGLVTGRSTAALQDMLKIFRSRFPLAKIHLFHSSVQGSEAPAQICQAIANANQFSKSHTELDVLIVARGGGSYEDLFCFNEESVVRAISDCQIPVVTGIGHEIDVTLADYVADQRFATPTHAAQGVVPDIQLLSEKLRTLYFDIGRSIKEKIEDLQFMIDTFDNRILTAAPQKQIKIQKDILKQIFNRIVRAQNQSLESKKNHLKSISSLINALSPLGILDRGFSLTYYKGKILQNAEDVKAGDQIEITLKKGKVKSSVLG